MYLHSLRDMVASMVGRVLIIILSVFAERRNQAKDLKLQQARGKLQMTNIVILAFLVCERGELVVYRCLL